MNRHFVATLLASAAVSLTSCTAPSQTETLSADSSASAEAPAVSVIVDDIPRFWEAYDQIVQTDDPLEQLHLLNSLYIDQGSPGLHAMMRARRYSTSEFITAINEFPEYWAAIRPKTMQASDYQTEIAAALTDLFALYDNPRDVPIYFVIGALRAGGTAIDGKLLIGAELALADETVPSHEFPDMFAHLGTYFSNNPSEGIVELNLHEYIHVVQRSTSGNDLLSQALFEGVAEYLSTDAIGRPSSQSAILYGKAHHDAVIAAFEAEIGHESYADWIWNSADNPFGQRDLGYYVGFVLAERYLGEADNRSEAIAQLIEMDYRDAQAVADVVDATGLFRQPVEALKAAYQSSRSDGL